MSRLNGITLQVNGVDNELLSVALLITASALIGYIQPRAK